MPEITLRDPCDIAAAERALRDVMRCRDLLLAAVHCASLAGTEFDRLARFAEDMKREVDITIVDTCLEEVREDLEQALNTPLPRALRRVAVTEQFRAALRHEEDQHGG